MVCSSLGIVTGRWRTAEGKSRSRAAATMFDCESMASMAFRKSNGRASFSMAGFLTIRGVMPAERSAPVNSSGYLPVLM